MPGMRMLISTLASRPIVPVIRLAGMIAANVRGTALSDSALASPIERAFGRGKPAAVALSINSPGGSPAQSSLIAARIRRLADDKGIPVHAFVEDAAASGGYWLACAADKVWVDQASIVGSIGVISASFGFHEAMDKLGIERRLYTAGKDKSLLDPFRPERADDVARLKRIQSQMHGAFMDHVRTRRGDRLSDDADLFDGDIWLGQSAVDVGLADGIAHLRPKLQELYGKKVVLPVYGMRQPLLSRFTGAAIAGDLVSMLEERSAWGRFGL